MNAQAATEIIRQALVTAFWIGLPLLAIGFFVGAAISLLQIITSMQDPAFASIPRLVAFLAGFLLFFPWMLVKMTAYATSILGNLGQYAR
ncbi:MAG: flagellar biosynthetic protein FliQ [Acidimicrobiia bacterium]|nr:flagellar biosynthetic protein FliQ [Acidimicrobiia bacterium]